MNPLILDFDGSAENIDNATRIDLTNWQEDIRFGCTLTTFKRLWQQLDKKLPAEYGTVLTGSGDYHHLSWPLIERLTHKGPFQVIVFDNHPDNMRFPFGIHCGSWVRKVVQLRHVSHVHVLGITSSDIGLTHAWENYLQPLYSGKLTYWCMDVKTDWAKKIGLGQAFQRFDHPDALIQTFIREFQQQPEASKTSYLTIDKDALSPETVRTNWDQGKLSESHLMQVISAIQPHIIGSDITGEVSSWQYSTWWKRLLSGMDGQTNTPQQELDQWQQAQRALNSRLLKAISKK